MNVQPVLQVMKDDGGDKVYAESTSTYSICGLDAMSIVTVYEALQSRRDQILKDLQESLKTERCTGDAQDDEFMFLSTLLSKVSGIMYLLRTETKDVF